MMLAFVLAALAAPATAVEAQRALALETQRRGLWTAFIDWSSDDAIMFLPKPENVHHYLTSRPNPSVTPMFWPSESVVSCDGRTAVNRGSWVRAATHRQGIFLEVWQKRAAGWRFILHGAGDAAVPSAVHEPALVRPASCIPVAAPAGFVAEPAGALASGGGASADRSLAWHWFIDSAGTRHIVVKHWTGRQFVTDYDEKAPSR